jgi:hypothetical protein
MEIASPAFKQTCDAVRFLILRFAMRYLPQTQLIPNSCLPSLQSVQGGLAVTVAIGTDAQRDERSDDCVTLDVRRTTEYSDDDFKSELPWFMADLTGETVGEQLQSFIRRLKRIAAYFASLRQPNSLDLAHSMRQDLGLFLKLKQFMVDFLQESDQDFARGSYWIEVCRACHANFSLAKRVACALAHDLTDSVAVILAAAENVQGCPAGMRPPEPYQIVVASGSDLDSPADFEATGSECQEDVKHDVNGATSKRKPLNNKYEWNKINAPIPDIYHHQFPFEGTQNEIARVLGKYRIINGATQKILTQRLNAGLLWGRKVSRTLYQIYVSTDRAYDNVKLAYDDLSGTK